MQGSPRVFHVAVVIYDLCHTITNNFFFFQESGVMTGSRVAMVGRPSPFSGKKLVVITNLHVKYLL
jgi:hypothetical protein